jgi:dipeptidyl aminopeptidase/acylaminoacyl peptidase
VVQRYVSASESELHVLHPASGQVTRLLPLDPPQYFDHACWVRLPETGRTLGLAFTSDRDGENHRLFLLRDGEDKPVALSPLSPWDVEWVSAGGDRRTLVYSLNEQGASVLHALKPGVTPYVAVKLPGLPKGIIDGALFHPSGKEFGFTVNGAAFPGEAFTYKLDARKAFRWTESETAGLPRDAFREPELIRYPTFDSVGTGKARTRRMIPAWLYTAMPGGPNPAVATAHGPSAPSPVLIQIHGGPEQQARAGFDPLVQYLANRLGVAVILPNVRGSSGYGKAYIKADDGLLRPGAVADIGALLDWIETRPDLDPARVAVAGRSYGGFMALASLTRYGGRLKGGVSTVGITHFPSFLKETSGYRRDLRRAEYGDERDPKMAAFLDSLSPVRHLDKLTQPLLLAHGKNDPRVPYAESVRLFEALKSRKVPVWLLTFHQEGHAFRSEASQTAYNRVLADFLARRFSLPAPP